MKKRLRVESVKSRLVPFGRYMMHVPSFRYFMVSICCVIARTSWNPVLSPDMCWKYASFSTWTDRLFTPASFKMAVTYKSGEPRSHRPIRTVNNPNSNFHGKLRHEDIDSDMEWNTSTTLDSTVCPDLLYDPLLHHIWHDLEVDGPRNHVGWMPPEMRVSVRQNSFNLLDLK